ncbi:nuclear transport factor 2 family protein [Rhizobium rhizogenes]|jgi:predicted SnoaL-like aldol condensation-catalyzing enzyme|uniref:nuclear transport factor 2 family protein n=1 Tax=Rhizobium rhizogenes TaxID=359 RepID=UPI0022C40A31|nr:nuclear transport factor 2 family protein [Rhizobium rhizogenes]MCZ7467163.1 nuclear transport factor 2 family protein [Rhizobium rhizogenes]MCZ7488568.1 nuclear transport factor 2 family protein [Rhizobium rhizogenes]
MNFVTRRLAIAAFALVPALVAAPVLAQTANRDLAQEEANRKLVIEFYDTVFNKHEVEKGAAVVVDSYKQHNPNVPDGKKPFVDYFTGFFKENPQSRARIVRSATDGDLVYLHIHSTEKEGDRGTAIVDIFRVTDGKITEHWDVIQPVPETAANNNTMF